MWKKGKKRILLLWIFEGDTLERINCVHFGKRFQGNSAGYMRNEKSNRRKYSGGAEDKYDGIFVRILNCQILAVNQFIQLGVYYSYLIQSINIISRSRAG